ncbi:MAG: flagellar hook-length control protein FliK [Treponema sp.]|nr:flagellar hook-length control protein FliK [Treponema sp.]
MQAAIVNTIVDLKNLQVSSSQDFTSQNSSPIAKDYSVSHKSEEKVSSTEQKKSFEQMVKDIQSKDNSDNVEETSEVETPEEKLLVSNKQQQIEIPLEKSENPKLQKSENLLKLLESGKINVKDLQQKGEPLKVSKKELKDFMQPEVNNEITAEEISFLQEGVVANFVNETPVEIVDQKLVNLELDEKILSEEILIGAQELSVDSPVEFLGDFSDTKFVGDEKIVSNLKSSKKFALDKEGKIIVTDLRTTPQENVQENVDNSKPNFVTDVKFDGNNSAQMTLDLANNVQQNLTSSNTQSAAASNSNFQAMLTNQIQQNAYDFVKTGSIILKDNDVGSIKLILHPESLGNVKIDLQISDNTINGKIVVASQEAFNAFKDSMDSLKQAFMQSGYETSNFDLNLAGQNNPSNNFANQQENNDAKFQMARTYAEYSSAGDVSSEVFEENFENSSKSAINIVA